MDLSEVFVPIEIPSEVAPKFALGFTAVGWEIEHPIAYSVNKIELFSSVSLEVERHSQGDDYITVPMQLSKAELKSAAVQCLIHAGLDRNILVYDTYGNGFSRLFSLMRQVHRRNQLIDSINLSLLTDIFISADVKLTEAYQNAAEKLRITIHGIDMDAAENFYKQMGGTYPVGCTNLLIGVSHKSDSFVMPFRNNNYGIAILNNKDILLGAY